MKKVKYIKRRLWAFFLSVALLAGTMPAIISAQDSNVSNSTLMEGAYGNGEIRLASIPNTTKILTTFVADKGDRSYINCSELVYTICTDERWSVPVSVEDDGTLDMEPFVYSGNNKGIIAWTNATKKFTESSTSEEIAKSMGMTLRNMVVEMHAFNITSEDEKKVFISYNLFYYRLAVLLYPRTSRPVLSRYLFREESRLTEHPGCTIYHQPLPDSTGGLGYWLWHLHERNGSLPRSHHRVLSCLLHIRNTVLLHIPVHPRLYLHNYTAIPCMHIYNCCGDN